MTRRPQIRQNSDFFRSVISAFSRVLRVPFD